MKSKRSVALLLLTVCWGVVSSAPPALGDILHMKGGGKIEGKIVEETKRDVSIETPFGVQKLPRTRIERIERKEAPVDEISRREKALAKDDADGHFELALFAKDKKFKKVYRRLLKTTLSIDADHEGTHRELGHVLYIDRWVTPEERDRLRQEDEKSKMRDLGLVEYNGRWVTPEEKENLEKGLVLYEGQWMTRDEMKRAQGFSRIGDRWVRTDDLPAMKEHDRYSKALGRELTLTLTDHLAICSELDENEANRFAKTAQDSVDRFLAEFDIDPKDLEWLGGVKPFLVMVRSRDDYGLLVDEFARGEPKVDAVWGKQTRKAYGFHWWDPVCTSIAAQGPRSETAILGHTLHHLGHLLLNRYQYNFKFFPPWLDEGFASLFEAEAHGRNEVFCLGRSGYQSGRRGNDLRLRSDWQASLRAAMEEGDDAVLDSLMRREINELGELDIAKSMAIIAYVRARKTKGWVPLIQQLRSLWPAGRPVVRTQSCIEAHQDAFRKALDTDPHLLDKETRSWFRSR